MTPFDRVQLVIADSLGIEPRYVGPDTTLVNLGVDSLSKAQLLLDLEDALKIEIPKDEENNIFRVQDIVKYLDPTSH